MEKTIFREKSIERISSPEQLDSYVKVSNPGVWMALAAIILLLIGAFVWAVFGQLDTTITVAATVRDGCATCYISKDKANAVKVGQSVRIGDGIYAVAAISSSPAAVTQAVGEYALYIGSLTVGEWIYEATFDTELADGVYEADIVVDSVSPISFILN